MAAVLNRLMMWHKFTLLGLFGVVLVAAPLILYVAESNKSIHAVEAKTQGIIPARAVLKVVVLTQQHRGLSAMVLAGNEAAQAQRAAKQDEVDKAFAAAEQAVTSVPDSALITLWKETRQRWSALPGKVAQKALSGKESFAEHTALVGQMFKLTDMLGDHYGLNLDTRADSYQLVSAALVHSPVLMETLGRMRARGSAMLTEKQASTEDRALLMAIIDKATDRYDAISSAVDKAVTANPALKEKLPTALQATLAAGKQALQLTQDEIVKKEQLDFAAPDYFAKLTQAIGVQLSFYDAAIIELEKTLQAHRADLTNTKYALIGAILLLSLLAATFGYLISRSITGPLAEAVNVARQVASGDLTTQITIRTSDETGQLLQALKDMNSSLVNIVTEVRSGTETIASASGQIAAGNLDLSNRTEQQASSLDKTASSMEEITGTVKQNADNARQANKLAHSASEVASKGGAMVSHVVQTMGSINDSSKKIVDIISVIDSIAFQTNILALNAAVEAARAGEQGKGFAVVASEVRNLAQRSASAAKEIKALINDSVETVDAGAKLVDQTGATMDEIVASIKRVSDIIAEITAASEEQSVGIEQVNEAITEMDGVTQQNASLVEEAAAAAEALRDQAQTLSQVVGVFRLNATQQIAQQYGSVTMLHAASAATMLQLPSDRQRAGGLRA